MNILVVTRECWSNNNSTGNTMTSIFEELSIKNNIYNLYFRESTPNNDIALRTFRISEKQIISKILKGQDCGCYVKIDEDRDNSESEEKIYNVSKKIKSFIPNFIREALWNLNLWQSENFISFIKEIKPDIVFSPVFPCWYTQKVLIYIKKIHPETKIVLFHADDCFSLKQFSFLPSFWLYRLIQRKWIRKITKISSLNYVISELQKKEYDKSLGINTKILTKFDDFSVVPEMKSKLQYPLKIVYTGNLSCNRWKTIGLLSNAIKKINNIMGHMYELEVYSATKSSKRQLKTITNKFCHFCGTVPGEEAIRIQKQADLLVHVEAFDLKNRLIVRQSFSTKIIDYLHSGKTILAIGPKHIASIDYFINNSIGIVATSKEEIEAKLQEVIYDQRIVEIARESFSFGRIHHSKVTVLSDFENDLYRIKLMD